MQWKWVIDCDRVQNCQPPEGRSILPPRKRVTLGGCQNNKVYTARHCNTLQLTATHCNTLQHTATHCNTLRHAATRCNTLQHTTCAREERKTYQSIRVWTYMSFLSGEFLESSQPHTRLHVRHTTLYIYSNYPSTPTIRQTSYATHSELGN